jgi:hypothetical protein
MYMRIDCGVRRGRNSAMYATETMPQQQSQRHNRLHISKRNRKDRSGKSERDKTNEWIVALTFPVVVFPFATWRSLAVVFPQVAHYPIYT